MRPILKRKPPGTWTDERLKSLHELRAEKLTGDQIADRIGLHRTTVFRKMNELGMIERGKKSADVFVFKPKSNPQERKPQYRPRKMEDQPKPLGPMNDFPESGKCQWVHGEPTKGDWQMCGHDGAPWCEYHAPLIHIPRSAKNLSGAV